MTESELTSDLIEFGYRQGMFPMADDRGTIQWYFSQRRALFPITGVRVSRSLARRLRSGAFEVTFDTAFEEVMRGCVRPKDNWINEDLIEVFTRIHQEGWAHSCEVRREGRLAGGVYGLALGGVFCAESMFHRETDASKVGLWALVERCRELGFQVFDVQVMNSHLASLGAYELGHVEYLELVQRAADRQTAWSRRFNPGFVT